MVDSVDGWHWWRWGWQSWWGEGGAPWGTKSQQPWLMALEGHLEGQGSTRGEVVDWNLENEFLKNLATRFGIVMKESESSTSWNFDTYTKIAKGYDTTLSTFAREAKIENEKPSKMVNMTNFWHISWLLYRQGLRIESEFILKLRFRRQHQRERLQVVIWNNLQVGW